MDLRTLVHKRRENYYSDMTTRDLLEGITWESRPPPTHWKPKGQLVAHLHEHRGPVNRYDKAGHKKNRKISTCHACNRVLLKYKICTTDFELSIHCVSKTISQHYETSGNFVPW